MARAGVVYYDPGDKPSTEHVASPTEDEGMTLIAPGDVHAPR